MTPDRPGSRTSQPRRVPAARALLRSLLRPSRFAMVGVLGIVVNAAALVVFTEWFGIHYAVSAVLASQVSTLNNFVLTELWVFRSRSANRRLLFRYLAFNALNVATLVIRVPVIIGLTEVAGIHYLVSNLAAIGLTFGVRYFIADNWIWAGRDDRDQTAIRHWYHYDIHGLVRLRSRFALPELAAFNRGEPVQADIVIHRRFGLGGWPRPRIGIGSDGDVIRYREQLGAMGVAFDVALGPQVVIHANWLLAWSHHVLYTNLVEPILRLLLASRGSVLLHAAALATDRGAILMSAQTDTGKTSTLLKLLMRHPWGFIGDDMAIIRPDGRVLSFPKPMTLSSHTMSAVSDAALPFADRFMLAIRSRVHSKQGRSIGHALGRLPLPIVTINAVVQLLVPPPKYHVSSLVECEMADEAPLHAVFLMSRGPALREEVALDPALDVLLANTEDAYTFPPFGAFSPHLRFDGLDLAALRARERALLASAVAGARRVRLQVPGHGWAEEIPRLLGDGELAVRDAGEPLPVAEVAKIPH